MPPILAALGRIAGTLESVIGALKGMVGAAEQIVELGLYGAGGVTLKLAETVFSKIENAPFFKKFNVDFGSKYMTPFGTTLYWAEIQKQIYTANRQLGIAGQLSKTIEANTISAGTAALQYGFSEKEIVENYQDFIQEYGRNTIFSDDDLLRLTKINFAFGESFNGIFALTKLYGASIDSTYEFMNDLNKDIDRFGLNSKKVYADIKSNIRLIDQFNFKNGVKGLGDMVVQADRLGMKMEDIAGFGEKILNPEDAIDVSASLQMLGGEFAKLGDPFSLLYDANNDLEGLGDKLRDITKGMGALNKETGMVDLSSLEMRQLREFTKITGQSLQDVAQQAKLMRKEDLIGQALSPDLKKYGDIEKYVTKIAGMADFTGGVPKITIENQQKLVSDLTSADIEKLSQISVTPNGDSFSGLIASNQTIGDKMAIFSSEFTRAINKFEYIGNEISILNNLIAKGTDSLKSGAIGKTADVINQSKLGSMLSLDRVLSPALEGNMGDAMSAMWDNMDMGNAINTQVIDSLKNLLGPNSTASSLLQKVVDVESAMHEGIGVFGQWVAKFGGWVSKLTDTTSTIGKVAQFSTPTGLASMAKGYFNSPDSTSISTNTNTSYNTQEETLKLFKENEQARQTMEANLMLGSTSTLEVKAANASHKIEFSWNGKVYNVYDLFDDPKFVSMLRKDMGEVVANQLLSHYSNGGKNTQPH